mmetsp:Transcript_16958/g.30487  ORF Transcript_16958/g.30487 Transcript_16958/m.30487 type:complete len:1881 (+) Transcript_16958:2021-7663(+)
MDKLRLSLISASRNLRAGVGAFGQIYVWGNNRDRGLGIDDIDELVEPTFVDLKHNYYTVKAKEVACGADFVIVLGQNRIHERADIELDVDEEQSFNKFLYMLREYCNGRRKTLIDIYKSLKLREPSFYSITLNEIIARFPKEIQISESELRRLVTILNMNIAGKRISVLPLYEHLEAFMSWNDKRIELELREANKRPHPKPKTLRRDDMDDLEESKRSRPMGEMVIEEEEIDENFNCRTKTNDGQGLLFILGNFDTMGKSEHYEYNDLNYQVVTLRSQEYFTKIACGKNFVIAATNMQRIYTWANDPNSPIVSPKNVEKHNTPSLVFLAAWTLEKNRTYEIKGLAAGEEHVMVWMNSNSINTTSSSKLNTYIYTWGGNAEGCLGLGHNEPKREPIQIQTIREDKIIGIAAGYNQSLIILENNTVKAWGNVPLTGIASQVMNLPMLHDCYKEVRQVVCGETYNLVLNTRNQLIRIGREKINYTEEDDKLNDPLFTQVCGSNSVLMALTSNGTIYSWLPEERKSNLVEETKDEAESSNSHPERPSEIRGYENQFAVEEGFVAKSLMSVDASKSRKIVKIAATSLCSFAMTKDGQMYATGSGVYGMLGITSADGSDEMMASVDKFIPIPRLSGNSKTRVIDIACGNFHVLAITQDNKLIGWGRNDCGQLGLGHLDPTVKAPSVYEIDENLVKKELDPVKEEKAQAVRAKIIRTKSLSFIKVSCGEAHSIAMTTDGELYAFGSAESGRLGIGEVNELTMYHTPEKVEAKNNKFETISAGCRHNMAIDSSHKLWGWGTNTNRQLGTGTNEHCRKPEQIWNIENAQDVSCGVKHTVALDKDGHLFVWGEDKVWDDQSDISLPTKVMGDNRYVKVFAGTSITYAIEHGSNRLFVWGDVRENTRFPQLLVEKAKEGLLRPTLVNLNADQKASSVVCAVQHTLMLENNEDELYGWGNASGGRLGVSEDILENPTLVLELDTREDKKEEVLVEEEDMQEQLVNEPEEQKERYLLESDQLLMKDFADSIDNFLNIIQHEREEEMFFEEAGRKMLARIAQAPFKAEVQMLRQEDNYKEIIRHASMLISTFQLHPCYVFNLLKVAKNSQTMLNLIYVDMEGDDRLIYAALLLSKKLLEKALATANIDDFKIAVMDSDYKYLIKLIMKASTVDMRNIRELARNCLAYMTSKISDDKLGIVTNPVRAAKRESMNAVNAYATNKKTVDRRVESLKGVLEECIKGFVNTIANVKRDGLNAPAGGLKTEFLEFSSVATFIVKDLFNEMRKKQPLLRLDDRTRVYVKNYIVISVMLLFGELFDAIKDPINYGISIELNFEEHQENLENLSNCLKYLMQKDPSNLTEAWMKPIKNLVENEVNYNACYDIIKAIYDKEVNLDRELLIKLFEHSLVHYDIQVNINYNDIFTLANLCKIHVDKIRINTGKYDPIVLINKATNGIPKERPENVPLSLNLILQTRCLRHEQSLVRCPICKGIIVREMAPSTYEQVFKLFEPMAPTSPVAMLSEIFVKGPKKSDSITLENYLTNYRESCIKGGMDLKTADIIEQIKGAINIQVTTESSRAISEGIQAKLSEEVIAQIRGKLFERLEKDCLTSFLSRKTHFADAELMRQNLIAVNDVLVKYQLEQSARTDLKLKLMFNLEYGASNRELQVFSDAVMFRIFMLKVREYTEQRPMSIQLFENLKKEMTKSLKGFSKLTLKSLRSNRTILSIDPPEFDISNLEVSIEQVEDGYMFVFFMPATKGVFFGESKVREDKVYGYHTLKKRKIIELSNTARVDTSAEYMMELLNKVKLFFKMSKLVKLMNKIDSQVIIYDQNAELASENLVAKTNDEKETKSSDREAVRKAESEHPKKLTVREPGRRPGERDPTRKLSNAKSELR